MIKVRIPSRNTVVQFADDTPQEEIFKVLNQNFPKTGADVAYNVGQQLQELQKSGGINTIEASNPISALSLEDFQLYKKHQLENGIGLKEGLPLIGDAAKHIVGAIFNGALEIAKDPFSKATYESALHGLGASVVGSGQLGQGIRDIVGKAADFVTGQTPHLSREEYRAAYPKTTDADWEQYMQAEQDRESKMLNYTLLADSLIKNAPKPEVAEVFSMVGLEDLATMGGASAARNVGKQVAEQVGKKTLLGKLADLTEKTRQGVLRGVEKTAKGVETVADLPQTVKEKLGGTVAGGIVGAGLASAGLAPTAGVLTGAATLKTGSSLLGGAARAAMEGPSRVGWLERMAQDTKMSKAAQRYAGALAQLQPAFRYAGQNVAEATKGAIGGGVVGGGMGYIVGGEEGMYSGIGSGIGIGGTSGLLGANIDFAKEAMGMSTSRTKAAAAGDIQRFVASRDANEAGRYVDLFNRLTEKSSVEQAANTMDFIRIAEANGKRVRFATKEEAKNQPAPGWADVGKKEIVLNPDKILNDTAAHEVTHLMLGETAGNALRPQVERAIFGLVDPATGEQLKPGIFDNKTLAKEARDIARAYAPTLAKIDAQLADKSIKGKQRDDLLAQRAEAAKRENEAAYNEFVGHADMIETGNEPDNVNKAKWEIADEMVATYAGKLLSGRTKPGKFNPDRLPLAYRGALDSLMSSFLNTVRTESYRAGADLNLGSITTAFKSKTGKNIRIPELDNIITKAFAERAKGARAESKVLELPKNPKDLEVFTRAYGLGNVMTRDAKGNLRPKTGRELLDEARSRWADTVSRLQALPEEERVGIDFSTDKNGQPVMKVSGQLSQGAIDAIASTLDKSSQTFLKDVLASLGNNKKTTLNSTYYGVYERGKATNRMVAKVKEASHNEILPYAVEINSKDGIIVRAINMTSVFDRMADKLQRGSFKGLYPDYDTALRDFTKYLDNLTAQTPIDSAILLGGGEKGARKRNFFYDVLGFRNRKGESMINVPESEFKGRDAVNNVRSYRIERFTQLSPTNQGYSFDVATTYERAMKNFQPSEFVEETLPGGMASRNEQGWRILKRDDQKLFRVYNDLGEVVGVAGSKEDAADMALKKFVKENPEGSPRFQASEPDQATTTSTPNFDKVSANDKPILQAIYFKNQDKFKEAVNQGRVKKGVPIETFQGNAIAIHQPDSAMVGDVVLHGDTIVRGQGGVYYPVLFGEKGSFWASTESAANAMAAELNKISKLNNGKILMGLTSAPIDKLFSSTTMSTGMMNLLHKVSQSPKQYGINAIDANKILVNAVNTPLVQKVGNKTIERKFNQKLSSSTSLEANIELVAKMLNPDQSAFPLRKHFVMNIAKSIADHLSNKPRFSKAFASLISPPSNKYASEHLIKGRLSKSNIIQALGDLFSEEFTKDFQSISTEGGAGGYLYAIIEMDGEVVPVQNKQHGSYDYSVDSTSGQQPKVSILNRPVKWNDALGLRDTGDYVPDSIKDNVYPTNVGFSFSGKHGHLMVMKPKQEARTHVEITRFQPAENTGAIGTIDNDGNPVLVKTRNLGAAKHANHREITATGNDDGSRDFRFNASNGMVYWWNPGAVSSAEKQKLTDYLTAEGYTVKGHANVRDDFGAAHGAKYSPAEVDADYLAAVKAGDLATAQRMVDEAAKAANATYVAKVPIARLSYGELPGVGEERKLRDGDAQPLIVERTGAGDTLALADGYHRLEGMILNGETEVTVIILNSEDSDSVSGLGEQKQFRRIQEEHAGESADPVTYDDAGNVIPLSQRFQTTSPDIRFQPSQDSGGTQANEPSPGGLTEAEWQNLKLAANFHLESFEPEARSLAVSTVERLAPTWDAKKKTKAIDWLVNVALERQNKMHAPDYISARFRKWIPMRGSAILDFETFGRDHREKFFRGIGLTFHRATTGSIYIFDQSGENLARIADHSPSEDRDVAKLHIFKRREAGNEFPIEEQIRLFIQDHRRRSGLQNDEAAKVSQGDSSDIRFQPSQLTARDIDAIAAEVGGGEVKGGAKAFGAFMRSMREKGITLRDVVKSYGITLSSIRRQERKAETIKKNWPDAPFADGEQIRPEDAFATLLGTPEGKRYLDDAEKGEFNEAAADAMMQKFRAFGFHNKLKEQMQTAATQFFPQAQKIIDAVNNMPADEFIEFVRGNVKGISHGKIGFWSGQLGRGDLPTFDSRQGKLVYGKEVPVSKKVLLDQKARLPLLGIKVPDEYKDFAQTLLHHEIWDRLNGSDTEHAPIKEAMLKYSPDPVSPDILNGSDGSRLLKPKSGKWRIYSPAGILAGVRESQLDAENFALKKARMGWK